MQPAANICALPSSGYHVLRIAFLATLLCAGCSFHWPRVAHVPVQQGNVITQDMINKLKPGMTHRQVAFVMGEPVLRNTFDADRWDYVHSFQIGNTSYQETRVSLFFKDDVLMSFSGDLAPTATDTAAPPADSEFAPPENDPVINDDPDF